MKKEMNFFCKGKSFSVDVKSCNLFQKGIGLMFSRREKADNLIFKFDKKRKIIIHSFFVFFPFVALWLDDKNEVVDAKIVKPFVSYVSPSEKTNYLVEIPINKKNKKIVENLFLFCPSLIRKI